MAWQLRQAGVDDLEPIMRIENATFGADAWSSGAMRAELASKQGYYLVAFRPETPGQIEGYAGLLVPAGSEQADIQTIAVVETARRSGLGRMLVQTLIGEARNCGAAEIFLEVRADNPTAEQLYRSLGFEQIAVRPRYYQPDGVDALVMRLTVPELGMGKAT